MTDVASVEKKIADLAIGEQDPPVRYFFTILKKRPHLYHDIVKKAIAVRPDITDEHLAYLLYIAVQYVSNFGYDEIPVDEAAYDNRLNTDMNIHADKLVELCQTQSATTSLIERYAGLQVVLGMLGRPGMTVVDLGSSIGIGLMALNTDSFGRVTLTSELQRFIKAKASIAKAIGIDSAIDPNHIDMKWQLACYLPQVRDYRDWIAERYEQLKETGMPITLIRGSALALNKITELKPYSADVVWTSNMLYMLAGDYGAATRTILSGIKWLLKPDGVWIDADYRDWTKPFATPENPYVIGAHMAPDWERSLEVLISPDDTVRTLRLGKDFEKFKSVCAARPASD